MDNNSLLGHHDASTVDLNDPHEINHWTSRFKITEDQLRKVVEKVGVQVDDVVKELEAANREKENDQSGCTPE